MKLQAKIILLVAYNLLNIQFSLSSKESLEDVIMEENYPCETHKVTTEDGYIITLHRIPGPIGSIPVHIQHGLLSSSRDWLKMGKGRALPYILSDNGYDVWIGNARGNTHSREHVKLSTSDPQFWNFSWHEVGYYDISAIILYISKMTNNTVFYVGHSMGGSTFSVMATQRPEIAKNIRAMIGLSPAVYEYNIEQYLIKKIAEHRETFESVTQALNVNEFLPQNLFTEIFLHQLNHIPIIGELLISNVMFFLFGYSPNQLDYSKLPILTKQVPSGTSVKLFCHWLQQMTTNEFRNYDYGHEKNILVYNSTTPPKYDLTKIEVPIAVFLSDNDKLVTSKDVRNFYRQVPNKIGLYDVDGFNHVDFLWGINATELVYNKIVNILKDQQFTTAKHQRKNKL